jgi:hypothetical protein
LETLPRSIRLPSVVWRKLSTVADDAGLTKAGLLRRLIVECPFELSKPGTPEKVFSIKYRGGAGHIAFRTISAFTAAEAIVKARALGVRDQKIISVTLVESEGLT